jgi:MYXO-CTERM domain-containing protein
MQEVVGTKQWRAGAAQGDMQVPAVFFASRTSQTGEVGRRGGGSMIFINLDPSAAAAGKVADLTLSYRLPNTNEIISHSVSLDYDRPPTEAVEEPFLSYAEMAERFAMYNTFLGFRLATQMAASNDYNCAMSVLSQTRSAAQSWNASHQIDPDIAADVELADMFIANLRAQGADSEFALSNCPAAQDPHFPDGEGGWDPDAYNHPMACSASHANAGWLLILGAVFLIRRRRR